MSSSLWPHGLQHTRLPCPSPSPRVCSNSRPLSQWCHPTISSSVIPLSFCLLYFPASGFFSNESAFHIRWPKYWISSFSPSNEYSGLVSFRINWFDLIIQGTSDVAAVRRCRYFCDIRQSQKLGSMSHTQSSEAHTVWSGCNEAQLLSVSVSLYPRFTV